MKTPTPTVFIIDDDPSVRSSLARLMRSANVNVETFASGDGFLARERPQNPGCVVLDLKMPKRDGLEVQQDLSAAGIHLPIIFLTAHGTLERGVQAMKDGAVDFLAKPVDGADLLRAIETSIDRSSRAWRARSEMDEIEQAVERLTKRERQVFERVAAGLRNKNVGAELGIAEKTVKVHRGRVMKKLGATSLAELVRMAARLESSRGS